MIKEIPNEDVKRAIDLVNDVFSEFVAVDYSEQGRRTFESYLKNKLQEISADLQSGHKQMWAYYQGDEIVGVIATRDRSHIALMFVAKEHHKKGIAKQLFSAVLQEAKKDESAAQITVNSSPYAVAVYERLGFVKTDEEQERDGILFVPMKYPL